MQISWESLLRAQDGGGPSFDGSPPDISPAAVMRRAHVEKLRLCEALEDIADSLPAQVDRLRCLHVANGMLPLLRSIHRYEEGIIFPAYEAGARERGSDPASTQRLRAEHLEDECLADELTETLLSIGHGYPIDNPEALGFMLRALFETMRRHIGFEHDHILPAIGEAS